MNWLTDKRIPALIASGDINALKALHNDAATASFWTGTWAEHAAAPTPCDVMRRYRGETVLNAFDGVEGYLSTAEYLASIDAVLPELVS